MLLPAFACAPLLQLFHEGDDEEPIDFEGERDADGIVAFVDRWMAPAVASPATPAEARALIADSSAALTVLVLFGDHNGAAAEAAVEENSVVAEAAAATRSDGIAFAAATATAEWRAEFGVAESGTRGRMRESAAAINF